MVVNERTWPFLEVEPRRYRFRCLYACNSGFLILKIVSHPLAGTPSTAALPFWQIGADSGFLPSPLPPRPPEDCERGFKDTVVAYPREITRVKALFDLAGLYVWHRHIVEHEDNG